jgi:hypothetical protein
MPGGHAQSELPAGGESAVQVEQAEAVLVTRTGLHTGSAIWQ